MTGCTENQAPNLINNTGTPGLNLFTMSIKEGINGVYHNQETTIYFKAKRGGKNPWIERTLFDAPTYSVDSGFFTCNGDLFEGSIGGDRFDDPQWLQQHNGTNCNDHRTEDFRAAWVVANSLEKMNIPKELKWEKEALIQTARSINESDLIIK